ncbi:UNVERIFIED_CONTAM: hypothetical protein GTU68_003722 [Idotea baltica]|nr:hypothetical protein [Idotea baltica]
MEIKHFFSPGRVNVIGEHIDYNGGLVMPIAIAQGIAAKVEYINEPIIKVSSKQLSGKGVFNLNETLTTPQKQGKWTDYVLGVIHFLQKEGKTIYGCNIETESDLPLSSGLSSSAALEVLVAYLLQYNINSNENNIDLTELAVFCQKVENEFVGVNCGVMDQFAVANGQQGFAMCLNCNTLENEQIPFDLGAYSLVVINSKQPRNLAESAYNERRVQCDEALRIINQHKTIENLCSAAITDINLIKNPLIKQRAKHVITEQQRVIDSISALKQNNIMQLGKLLTQSHNSLNANYAVSSDALNLIVETSNAFEHCLGARLTGAGFGGCCIALVKTTTVNAYQETVGEKYFQQFSIWPDFYITHAEDGVRLIK